MPDSELKDEPKSGEEKRQGREGSPSAACSRPFPWCVGGVQGVANVGYFLLMADPGGGVGGPGGFGQGRALASVSKPIPQRKRGNFEVETEKLSSKMRLLPRRKFLVFKNRLFRAN